MSIRQPVTSLNEQQQAAVAATRGPVCILAGAGTGKTTTITQRIAAQVLEDVFLPPQILAVTFTNKAAGELVARLSALSVGGVNARTFHSAALQQLRFFAPERCGEIMASKGRVLARIGRSLPKPYRFRPLADLATEIEWAKNQRIAPGAYLDRLGSHEPPVPAELMQKVYRRYEADKDAAGLMDFEDLLERTAEVFTIDGYASERLWAKYQAFTVDEYQDVNLLQQTLLEAWLGGRDDICVVGDDYQSIYSFTGATPRHLLEMPQRYPRTKVFRLEENHRSVPEILAVANRLVPRLGGAEKKLRAVKPAGDAPVTNSFASASAERVFIVERIKALAASGTPLEQIAILLRINASSEDHEDELSRAAIPYQVAGGSFLRRPAARGLHPRLVRAGRSVEVAAEVERAAEAEGFLTELPDDLGQEEETRQRDLARFVSLAVEFEDGTSTVKDFIADLERRFIGDADGRGVHILTLHRAKGLEWDAVFIPHLQEGEIPFRRALRDGDEEERRLLYVGITRARRHLHLTWVDGEKRKPSRFLTELHIASARRQPTPAARPEIDMTGIDPKVVVALKEWRLTRSRTDEVPAYVVMHDKTLHEVARARPKSLAALSDIPGLGPKKSDRYGPEILQVLSTTSSA